MDSFDTARGVESLVQPQGSGGEVSLSLSPPPAGQGRGEPSQGFSGTSRRVPPKLYRIGEVVDYSGVSRQTIHNYTTMGLLHESRWTSGGHRLYDETVFERLDKIAELKAANKSMQDIRDYFTQLEGQSG